MVPVDCVSLGKPRHLSLHFDGVRVGSYFVLSIAPTIHRFCKMSEEAIFDRSGYNVIIQHKQHQYLMNAMACECHPEDAGAVTTATLLELGNCILLALARLDDRIAANIHRAFEAGSELQDEIADHGARSYRSCFTRFGIE